MAKPPKSPDATDDLMPWAEIGRQLQMPVADVRRQHDGAIDKLRTALEAEGLDIETVRSYLHMLDQQHSHRERMIQYLNLHYPHWVDPSGQ